MHRRTRASQWLPSCARKICTINLTVFLQLQENAPTLANGCLHYRRSAYLVSKRHLPFHASRLPLVVELHTSTHPANAPCAHTPQTKPPAALTVYYIPAKNSHWCHFLRVWLAGYYVIPNNHWLQLGGGFCACYAGGCISLIREYYGATIRGREFVYCSRFRAS